jgi:hypothetical protein
VSEYLRELHGRVSVHQLDGYLNDISFRSEAWRGSIDTIPKHSVVVLDPDTKAKDIDEFLESGRYPFRHHTKSKDTHRSKVVPNLLAMILLLYML